MHDKVKDNLCVGVYGSTSRWVVTIVNVKRFRQRIDDTKIQSK